MLFAKCIEQSRGDSFGRSRNRNAQCVVLHGAQLHELIIQAREALKKLLTELITYFACGREFDFWKSGFEKRDIQRFAELFDQQGNGGLGEMKCFCGAGETAEAHYSLEGGKLSQHAVTHVASQTTVEHCEHPLQSTSEQQPIHRARKLR